MEDDKIPLNTARIFGIPIISASPDQVLRELADFVAKSTFLPPLVVFTPNPEFLVEASEDSQFRELLNKADINLPDGVGLVWAGRVLGTPIKERISGADIVEELLEIGNGQSGWVVGITGERRGVQEEANELVRRLGEKYPNVKFVNLDNPQFTIYNLQFTIIFACQGMGKQEKWIMENKDNIKAQIFMGIGGSLDFITGFTRRAPIWMQRIGLEWLWRGLQRPEHFKRVWKAVFVFGWMMIREKICIRNNEL